ncbi:MAG: hypothetical protein ACI94Y_002131 [Maribacter sp.]|jgi:hypothetical protein
MSQISDIICTFFGKLSSFNYYYLPNQLSQLRFLGGRNDRTYKRRPFSLHSQS